MQWIKWYGIGWINSTARDELEPEERGTFVDFVCLASFPGNVEGTFKVANWEGLSRKLNTPLKVIESTRDKCLKTNRIKIHKNEEGIYVSILNWSKYQAITPERSEHNKRFIEGKEGGNIKKNE